MKQIYSHFLRIIVFFLLLFGISRLCFLLYNNSLEKKFSWAEALPAFLHGMRMDLSVIAYFLIIPILIAIVYSFRPVSALKKVEYYFLLFILLLCSLMLPANIILFHHWGSLLNFRALSYLQDFGQYFHHSPFFSQQFPFHY